jgi:hypothetical protein
MQNAGHIVRAGHRPRPATRPAIPGSRKAAFDGRRRPSDGKLLVPAGLRMARDRLQASGREHASVEFAKSAARGPVPYYNNRPQPQQSLSS